MSLFDDLLKIEEQSKQGRTGGAYQTPRPLASRPPAPKPTPKPAAKAPPKSKQEPPKQTPQGRDDKEVICEPQDANKGFLVSTNFASGSIDASFQQIAQAIVIGDILATPRCKKPWRPR